MKVALLTGFFGIGMFLLAPVVGMSTDRSALLGVAVMAAGFMLLIVTGTLVAGVL